MRKNYAREEAFLVLNAVMRKGAYSDIELHKNLSKSDLNKKDKALVTEIVYGTLRNLLKIDWIIDSFVKIKKNKVSESIQDILRCGTYQILFLDRVPDSAVCNESVEIAKKYHNKGASGFVNGVLRSISRNKNNIKVLNKDRTPKYLSIQYSHPIWMVELWLKHYGYDFTEELLRANNKIPPLTIRINSLKTSKEMIEKGLKELDINYEEGLYNKEAINLKGVTSIETMDLFKKGYFQIQDESSMLVGRIMDPKEGDFIIDVCAAPGGKSTHLAELMKDRGKIIARDIHKHKLNLIKKNCERLGITIIDTQLFDAIKLDGSLINSANKVLVDVPCSGLGLVRNKPDLRWKKTLKDIEELKKIQLKMLKNAARYVKVGGMLLYSTCTLNPEENIEQVNKFLDFENSFSLARFDNIIPKNMRILKKQLGYIELYPNIHGTDGFFIALMVRNNL